MPPRSILLELATRRNSYVCRSCLTALGISKPAPTQRFIRGYAGDPKDKNGAPTKEPKEPPKPPKDESDKGFTVNYFEKDPVTGELTRIAMEDEGKDDDDEDLPDMDDLESHLEELDRTSTAKAERIDAHLEKLTNMTGLLERIVEKHGPPGALQALNKMMAQYDDAQFGQDRSPAEEAENDEEAEEDEEDEEAVEYEDTDDVEEMDDDTADMEDPRIIDRTGDSGIPPILLTDLKHPGSKISRKRTKIVGDCEQLDKWINRAMGEIKRKRLVRTTVRATWNSFANIRPLINTAQAIVPREAWDALWTIFSHEGPENPHRSAAIWGLQGVMVQAGVPLSDEQRLQALEATFEAGHRDEAVATWKRLVTELGNKDSAAAVAYWELGVCMFAQIGDTARAERASKALFDRSTPYSPADSRVLFHLIRTYCSKDETAEKGFNLYRRMRDLATKLEKPMDIGDYDDVIHIFLKSGHTDYAMFAFTDMMLAGTVNLYGKSKLPNTVRNSFFFGKWLKRLIGAGDLDGAYNVLVFMQKNGVVAAAIQLNGLVGGWLRSGTVLNRRKAEDLAWAMIRSRKSFVELRERQRQAEGPARFIDNRPNRTRHTGPDLDLEMVPRATVETFVLLAENYRERGMFTMLEELFVAFKECKMPGDALMMNELMAAAVSQNRGDKARELYQLMVHEHGIVPNVDTFAVLFSSLPVNLLRGKVIGADRVPAFRAWQETRALFRDMMESRAMRGASSRNPVLTEPQVKLILHTFRRANDWAGMVAAILGLRDVVGYRMTRGVALELLAEVERIERSTNRNAKAAIRATVKLQQLVAKMQSRGPIPGIEGTTEGVKDPKVLYQILLDYYHTKVQTAEPDYSGLIREAKEEMGVTAAIREVELGQRG